MYISLLSSHNLDAKRIFPIAVAISAIHVLLWSQKSRLDVISTFVRLPPLSAKIFLLMAAEMALWKQYIKGQYENLILFLHRMT